MTEPVIVATQALRDIFASPICDMRYGQAELITAQLQIHQKSIAIQTQVLESLATPHEADHLRKLMEKYPQFPQFTGRSENLLGTLPEGSAKFNTGCPTTTGARSCSAPAHFVAPVVHYDRP